MYHAAATRMKKNIDLDGQYAIVSGYYISEKG